MKLKLVFASCAFLFLNPLVALSAESIAGPIVNVGNHNVNNVCYATLGGVGAISTCNQAVGQVRWDCSTEWGKRWYANMLVARVTGLVVTLHIQDNACSEQGSPTFDYGSL